MANRAPDFQRWMRLIREELAAGLVLAAQHLVRQTTEKIHDQVDINSLGQQQNTPKTQAYKDRRFGHHVPLRWFDHFSDPARYRVDGQPIGWALTAKSEKLAIAVQLPSDREEIVCEYLPAMGYRPPWGLHPETKDFLREEVLRRVRSAKQLIATGA